MTDRYKVYPEYKDSGVEWLDCLPLHWKTVSLKMLIDVRDGTHDTPSYVEKSDSSYPLVTSKDVTGGEISLNDCKQISKEDYRLIIKRSAVSIGDILMPMIGTVGSPILIKDDSNFAIKNLALFKTSDENSQVETKYLLYFLNGNECSLQFSLESRGGVQNFVSLGTLRSLGLPLASLKEQQTIANFLDYETAQIDTLIAKQEKLIELLKEKRQAVISHAVTKGLNSDAPMKDSGVEWLGEVPEHWLVGSLRWQISISSGEGLSSNLVEKNKTELKQIPVIGGNGVMGFSERSNTHKIAIAIGRVGALCGNVHLINYISWITDNALKISDWDGFDENYLINLLKTANLNDLASKTAQPLITGEQVKSLTVVIPPIEEQVKVNLKLTEITNSFDKLEQKSKDGINLLKERKTALISAAVTGKIDVRDWKGAC